MIEMIKEYIELQKKLREIGAINVGTNVLTSGIEVHMLEDDLIKLNGGTEGLKKSSRNCKKFIYEVYFDKDDVHYFCIVSESEFMEKFNDKLDIKKGVISLE